MDAFERYELRLSGGAVHETVVFMLFEDNDRCLLRCEYRNRTIENTATDFFQALCDLRDVLAKDGLTPICYGASLNVFPSGMARDMGLGLKAYKLAKGRHAKMEDLVEIFAEGPDIVLASVDAQEQFFRDWLVTPRS